MRRGLRREAARHVTLAAAADCRQLLAVIIISAIVITMHVVRGTAMLASAIQYLSQEDVGRDVANHHHSYLLYKIRAQGDVLPQKLRCSSALVPELGFIKQIVLMT